MDQLPKIVRQRLQATQKADAHPDPDLLAAFAEDSLGLREREGILAHLAHCAECREVLSLAQPEHAGYIADLAAMAEVEVAPARARWFSSYMLRWAVLAACLVVVASVVLLREERVAKGPVTVASKQAEARSQAPELRQMAKVETPANEIAAAKQNPAKDEIKKSPAPHPQESHDRRDQDKEAKLRPPMPRSANPQLAARGGVVRGGGGIGSVAFAKQSGASSMSALASAPASTPAPPPGPAAAPNRVAAKPPAAFAQALGGTIMGKVTDPSGAIVAGAQVSVKNANTGLQRATETTRDGSYSVAELPLGDYTVTITHPGFQTEVTHHVVVDSVLQARNLPVMVQVGSASEVVEVAATAPVPSALSAVAVNKPPASVELPLQGRNVIDLGQSQSQSRTAATTPSSDEMMGSPAAKAIHESARASAASEGSNRPLNAKVAGKPREETLELQASGAATKGVEQPANRRGLFNAMAVAARWTISLAGKVQRSFDQGKTWQNVAVGNGAKFRAVSALGFEIWAGGDKGLLYHSSDGGVIWSKVKPTFEGSNLTSDVVGIEFTDAQHGKVTTENGEVWMTSDGGLNWQKQ